MPEDDPFRRYLQAGMAWFSVTQQKAEGILKDLADSGETAVGQAQKAFERIVERGRQGSEELREMVRSEIREQVAALGLATKDDIARLEAKIEAAQAPPAPETPPPTAPETPPPTAPTAPVATPTPPGSESSGSSSSEKV
jgi:polyhydroxyalkanoate synthesis regulator phasin